RLDGSHRHGRHAPDRMPPPRLLWSVCSRERSYGQASDI
ncbi:MAG: hypothetical protein AVDCRST_MAG55-1725, partial [uncultured Rubrobacteraceae bacterium]